MKISIGDDELLELEVPEALVLSSGPPDRIAIGQNESRLRHEEGALEWGCHMLEHHEVGDREAGLDEAEVLVMGTPLMGLASSGTRKQALNVGLEPGDGDDKALLAPGLLFLGTLGAESGHTGVTSEILLAATIALEVGCHAHTELLFSSRRLAVDGGLPSATVFLHLNPAGGLVGEGCVLHEAQHASDKAGFCRRSMWNWNGRLLSNQVLEQLGHHDGGPAEFRSLGRLLYTMGTLISQIQVPRHDGIGAIIWRSVTREFRRTI